ncbi:MAG: chromate transporter [Polyangiales bacterium]
MIALELFYVCFVTSLLSFGGVHGALPEWQRAFVTERHWLTADVLMESYVVGQLAPGPSMVVAGLLGLRIAGGMGALAALLGTYTAPLAFAFGTGALLRRAAQLAWVRRVEVALRPLVVGFMAAAALGIVRVQVASGPLALVLVGAGAALAHARGWLGPVPLMLASGIAAWLLHVAGLPS